MLALAVIRLVLATHMAATPFIIPRLLLVSQTAVLVPTPPVGTGVTVTGLIVVILCLSSVAFTSTIAFLLIASCYRSPRVLYGPRISIANFLSIVALVPLMTPVPLTALVPLMAPVSFMALVPLMAPVPLTALAPLMAPVPLTALVAFTAPLPFPTLMFAIAFVLVIALMLPWTLCRSSP